MNCYGFCDVGEYCINCNASVNCLLSVAEGIPSRYLSCLWRLGGRRRGTRSPSFYSSTLQTMGMRMSLSQSPSSHSPVPMRGQLIYFEVFIDSCIFARSHFCVIKNVDIYVCLHTPMIPYCQSIIYYYCMYL